MSVIAGLWMKEKRVTTTRCEYCHHIRVEEHSVEYAVESPVPITPGRVLIGLLWEKVLRKREDKQVFYHEEKGICQTCVEKRNLRVLTKKEMHLIEEFLRLGEKLERIKPGFIKMGIERFEKKLSPVSLERLNPEVTERYKQRREQASEKEKLTLAKEYVKEIELDLWQHISNLIRESERKSRYAMPGALEQMEWRMEHFLEETEEFNEYCQVHLHRGMPYPKGGEIVMKLIKEKMESGERLQELCLGKVLTDEAFYLPVEYTRSTLIKKLEELKKMRLGVIVEEGDAFRGLLECLPARIVEEKFWQ